MTKNWIRGLLSGSVVAAALAAGVVGGSAVGDSVSDSSRPVPAAGEKPAPTYPKNDRGQTFGSDIDAPNPAQGPDLVRVYATNGKVGYVYSEQLNGPSFSSPQAASAWSAGARVASTIPVYESDGVTQIGDFRIG